jgi:zinc transporter
VDQAAFVHGFCFDGRGGARRLTVSEVESWSPADGPLWCHLDLKVEGVHEWLQEVCGLDDVTVEALTSEDPRPRLLTATDSLLAVFRGVNVNPGADPEDMVAIRCHVRGDRILTLRNRRIMAVQDLVDDLESGSGPRDPGGFLVELVRRLLDRSATIVGELEDSVDDLEDRVVEVGARELRPQLAASRRQAITLRRYLAPQRDVLARLPTERIPWLADLDRARLREEGERIARLIEDIDASRERAAVTQEELTNRLAEDMGRTMYLLSIVAAIFLPLGLFTGLLGINVGGIPGTDNPWAFTIVTVGLVAMAALLLAAFRRLHWL